MSNSSPIPVPSAVTTGISSVSYTHLDDLAHGVFGHRYVLIAVVALPDKGQTHGALAGVVGDGVGQAV